MNDQNREFLMLTSGPNRRSSEEREEGRREHAETREKRTRFSATGFRNSNFRIRSFVVIEWLVEGFIIRLNTVGMQDASGQTDRQTDRQAGVASSSLPLPRRGGGGGGGFHPVAIFREQRL